MTTIHF